MRRLFEVLQTKSRRGIETIFLHHLSSQPIEWLPPEVIEAPTLAVFGNRLDTILKEHEWSMKFNFKSDLSPIGNQSSKPVTATQ